MYLDNLGQLYKDGRRKGTYMKNWIKPLKYTAK